MSLLVLNDVAVAFSLKLREVLCGLGSIGMRSRVWCLGQVWLASMLRCRLLMLWGNATELR